MLAERMKGFVNENQEFVLTRLVIAGLWVFGRFSRVILTTLCAVKFNISLSEQMIPNNPKNFTGWWIIFHPVFFSFKVLGLFSVQVWLHQFFWSSELLCPLSLDSAWRQTSSGSDQLISWSHRTRHGFTSEELCPHTFEPGARLPDVGLPEAPAAAGGGEGPLDEVAESGGFAFISLTAREEHGCDKRVCVCVWGRKWSYLTALDPPSCWRSAPTGEHGVKNQNSFVILL